MLSEPIRQRIVEKYERLNRDGQLLTQSQLDQCYDTFRQKFGPQALSQLDGEALLETMHGVGTGNRDSLVYWLEFKNDDEFRTEFFGSIAGGSALKFGIYKRKESGEWAKSGADNKPRDISVDEAVTIARKHRDQLFRGIEALDKLPSLGSDDDYRQLQAQLDEVAPDVSRLSWGHKYFSMLFPDKLDDFHALGWQRFYLAKLLMEQPEEDGRYLRAGCFVRAAAEVGLPMVTFTRVLNEALGARHFYWRVGTSDGTNPRNRWDAMREGRNVAIGWPALGDLSQLEDTKKGREGLQALLEEKYPNTPSATGKSRVQITRFVTVMAVGDLVLAADGATVLGIGRVAGDYVFDPSADFPHQRPVEWLSLDEWKMTPTEGLNTTVHELKRKPVIVLQIEQRLQGIPSVIVDPGTGPTNPPPPLTGIAAHIQSVLERKSQVILYGPPGTGKTYWAEQAACDLAAISAFGRRFDALDENQRNVVLGTDAAPGLVRLCCFHPAYGYEDFLEGYRPETANGQMAFTLRAGVFKQLCLDATEAPDRRFYLIVDEINRGDIPRIFGELLTVLEKDKRGKSILLPVSRAAFRVPTNVFLIGTMNTADRSISLLDAALRRRFGFIELMPDSSVLKEHSVAGIPLAPWFEALNERICQHVGRDARNLQIGHSYLLQSGRPVKDIAALKRIVRDDLIPLIEEYCYENSDALLEILGAGFLDKSRRRIRYELFHDGREDELVAALKQPCPAIFTTAEATEAEFVAEQDELEDDDETIEEAL